MSEQATYSPGPWTFQAKDGCWAEIKSANDSDVLYACSCCEGINFENRLDLNLIASAPELLEALNRAFNYIDALSCRVKWTQRDQEEFDSLGIQAAIAKAQGGAA